ncbi:hypothetical protein CC78DRAFT_619120 [Lojkania enalia]|uniref:Uncharacterized protein n=1 Tax=Lojkania enalia TaxID=147567 RepID=A0A9P4K972_9PLEO|nr:hypothetical protein CC78DRAFT_619120 [Didymosphaeria enalia]
MPEAEGNRMQEDFILWIRQLDETWSANQLQGLINKEWQGEDYTPINDLITGFITYYRRIKQRGSTIRSPATGTDAGGASSSNPSDQDKLPRQKANELAAESRYTEELLERRESWKISQINNHDKRTRLINIDDMKQNREFTVCERYIAGSYYK